VGALLSSLNITPGSAGYLEFINVAKWILDPADPGNFADNLSHNTLAGPLSGGVQPPARSMLALASNCDLTVPNPFDLELHGLSVTAAGGPSALEVLTHVGGAGGIYTSIGQTSCAFTGPAGPIPVPEAVSGGGAVPHYLIVTWGASNAAPFGSGAPTDSNLYNLNSSVQGDIAAFFASGTIPPASRNAP
jgi:hypothetical protein